MARGSLGDRQSTPDFRGGVATRLSLCRPTMVLVQRAPAWPWDAGNASIGDIRGSLAKLRKALLATPSRRAFPLSYSQAGRWLGFRYCGPAHRRLQASLIWDRTFHFQSLRSRFESLSPNKKSLPSSFESLRPSKKSLRPHFQSLRPSFESLRFRFFCLRSSFESLRPDFQSLRSRKKSAAADF